MGTTSESGKPNENHNVVYPQPAVNPQELRDPDDGVDGTLL